MSYALRHCAVWVLSLFYFVEQITGQQSAASVFELSNQNFYQTLESWPADNGVFLEFYAHWCPACKRFQPQYEKLAAYFNAEPRVQPIVNVARVDCANERKLCAAFDIDRFPTMKFGKPSSFMKEATEKPVIYDGDREIASMVHWLEKQTDGTYNANLVRGTSSESREHNAVPTLALPSATDSKGVRLASVKSLSHLREAEACTRDLVDLACRVYKTFCCLRTRDVIGSERRRDRWTRWGEEKEEENKEPYLMVQQIKYRFVQVDLEDVLSSTLLAYQYALDSPALLKGLESRQAFLDFLDLLSQSHPLPSCRAGAKAIVDKLPVIWPAEKEDGPLPEIRQLPLCLNAKMPKGWGSCKGSKRESRGYTCGLWLTFHSMAARVHPESTGGAFWLTAVRGFVEHFFQCSDCSKHFVAMASEPAALGVTSRKDAVLWLWRSHNRVNKRLLAEEAASGDGDPAFPKAPWPPVSLCTACRKSTLTEEGEPQWDEEEVYIFLLRYYGASDAAFAAGSRKHLSRKHLGAATVVEEHPGYQRMGLLVVGLVVAIVVMRRRIANLKKGLL